MMDLVETIKAESRYYEKEDPMVGQSDIFGNIITHKGTHSRRRRIKKDRGHLQEIENQKENDIDNQNINSS